METPSELRLGMKITEALRNERLTILDKTELIVFEIGMHADIDSADMALAAVSLWRQKSKDIANGQDCFIVHESRMNARQMWAFAERHNGKRFIIITKPPA